MMTAESTRESDGRPEGKQAGGRRWILVVLGLIAIGLVVWFVRARARDAAPPAGAAAPGDRVVPVMVAPVVQRDVPIYLEGLGNVTPLQTVSVKSLVDGRLETVSFKEGQFVKRGDLIAQIDPRPFAIQLHTAEAAMARDRAQLRNATLNLERYKTLRQQNLIPQQQVDDQQTTADQQDAVVRGDQAQIETARLNLDYARITSPIDGVTGVRLVDPGNIVHAGDPTGIVVITQLDPIAALFTLPEDDLARVSKQLAASAIPVEAYSRDGATLLGRGQLSLIDNQVNTATATIRLKATFPNADRGLWPNLFVKARLLLTTRKGALVIPAAAVQRGPQGTFVYLASPDNTAAMRVIEVDTTQGELALVSKGLSPGELVVADGQNQLRPGAKIAPRAGDKGGDAPAGARSARSSGDAPAGSAPRAPSAASANGGAPGPGSAATPPDGSARRGAAP